MEQDRKDTDEMTVLSGTGDRELWYAEGGHGYDKENPSEPAWRFPLHVDYKIEAGTGRRFAAIFPAVCPHYNFGLVLKAFFEAHDLIGRQDKWLIHTEMVAAILHKAPGITPDRYYRWEGKEQKPIKYTELTMPGLKTGRELHEAKHLSVSGRDRALMVAIAEECGLQSSVVKIVLDGLNRVAADFLIGRHHQMDLGFVKLIAVPFRANWKEIVCFKLRKLGLLKLLKGDGCELGNTAGLPETLCSPHNVAIRREKKLGNKGMRSLSRVDYNIEVLTSARFEKEATALETRHRAAGHTAYVAYYEKTVERLYENILEILQAYRKKIGLPFARVHQSSQTGSLRFVETSGLTARAHGHRLRHLPVHIVPPARGFSAVAEESQQELVCEKAPEVSEVPAVLQTSPHLRQREERGALEELGNGQGGAGGLLVRDVAESKTSREPVLFGAEAGREPSWVEIIGD